MDISGGLMEYEVYADQCFYFYGMAILDKRLVAPLLHCVECSFLQHRWPQDYTKVFHISGVRYRCFEGNAPFDMGLPGIGGVLGIFPSDSVSGHYPSRYSNPFVRDCGGGPPAAGHAIEGEVEAGAAVEFWAEAIGDAVVKSSTEKNHDRIILRSLSQWAIRGEKLSPD